MKLLLDENLPHDLRHHLVGHDSFTVRFMKWEGTRNGALLALAKAHGFDAFLTMDNGVQYQQNLKTLPLAVIIMSARSNDLSDLLPLVPNLLAKLAFLIPGSVIKVR